MKGEWKIGDQTTSELLRKVLHWVEVWLAVRERQEAKLREGADGET